MLVYAASSGDLTANVCCTLGAVVVLALVGVLIYREQQKARRGRELREARDEALAEMKRALYRFEVRARAANGRLEEFEGDPLRLADELAMDAAAVAETRGAVKLQPGERMLHFVIGELCKGKDEVPGALTLTDRRIVFTPDGAGSSWSQPWSKVTSARPGDEGDGIWIAVENGPSVNFVASFILIDGDGVAVDDKAPATWAAEPLAHMITILTELPPVERK